MDLKYLEPTFQYIKDFKEKHGEYSEKNVEKIFVYMAHEGRTFTSNYFVQIHRKIVWTHNIDKSISLNFIEILSQDYLMILNETSSSENFQMPTEIKIIYDCVSDTFDTKVSYEKNFSVRKKIGPYEVFQKWFEDTKKNTNKTNN